VARFYLGWADEGEAFSESDHAVEAEAVLSFTLSQAEGEFAKLVVEILNPGVGLLSPGMQQWAWFSVEGGGGSAGVIEPLFFGRVVGIPEDIHGETVTITFVARPEDYEEQKAALAATLREFPFWDPVFVPPDQRENADFVLESRPAHWHIDRVTHVVTISDIIEGEDGLLNFASAPFYDSVSVSYGQAPVTRVDCRAVLTWVQKGTGSVDLSSVIEAAFAEQGGFVQRGFIASYTGGGLMTDWPEIGTNIGGGWKVGLSGAARIDGTILPVQLLNVDVATGSLAPGGLSVPWDAPFANVDVFTDPLTGLNAAELSALTAEEKLAWAERGIRISGYYVGTPTSVGTATISQFPQWNLSAVFNAEYDANLRREEIVTFSVHADVQPIVSDLTDSIVSVELSSAEIDQPVDEPTSDNPSGIPIYDTRRPSYMLTDRGKLSLAHLISLCRARALARARCVRVEFEDTFANLYHVSLRHSGRVIDPRIPGGVADGKVAAYTLSLAGQGGALTGSVSLACTIGRGGVLGALDDGEGVYVEDGVLEDGIQALVGGATAIAGEISYEDFDTTVIASNGVDLFNVTAEAVVDVITVENGFGAQQDLLLSQVWSDTNAATVALNEAKTRVGLGLVPLSGGDVLSTPFDITVSDLIVPKTIDLEAA
jgi:hypothetical protein